VVFSIGRFARLAGISVKALRAYDAFGLFRPVWVDPSSSYRYYSPAQLPELRRILALRDMGLGLAEIRALAAGGDLGAALERRRRELVDERREIDRRLRSLDITVGRGTESDVVVRPLPPEAVATLSVEPDEDDGAAFYELEAHVRDLGRRAHGPPGALVSDGTDGAAEIFVPVTGPIEPRGRIAYRRLPAVRAATIIQRGPYDRLPAARRALEGWVERTGQRVTAPLRILYLQFGAEPELGVPPGYVVDRAADYLTELQLPIATRPGTITSRAAGAPGSDPSRGPRRTARPR
jgi:DNA-binding transcriptional MerR regulator